MWDLLLNQDESVIVESVREYLARELPVDRLRPNAAAIDAGKALAGMIELGWLGVGLPEEVGGAALGIVGEMLVQRECARFLASPRTLAVVLAAHVAAESGETELAGKLIAGKSSAAIAFTRTPADQSSGACYLLDHGPGDVVVAWNNSGMGLFQATAMTGLQGEECLDESLGMQSAVLDMQQPLFWVGRERADLVLRANVLLAAALMGLAEHACDLTVEYAKVREQFGKPIATFQAVKHRCADMGIRGRLAWFQTSLAALKVQEQAKDAPAQVTAAQLLAAQAAHENGRAAIQLHGAIGFQSECDVHWFMKRAHVYDRIGGSARLQARSLAREASPLA